MGQVAQGNDGAMPDRASMIMVMKLSGSRKPLAGDLIRPMAALLDSAMPFVKPHSLVASIDSR